MIASAVVGLTRLISGSQSWWVGCEPSTRQRIYFANHTSHVDFVVLWSALPGEVRGLTRPVAARDYWDRTRLRRYLAVNVFRAVLVDRIGSTPDRDGAAADLEARVAAARRTVEFTAAALGRQHSLIIFPEGTRGRCRAIQERPLSPVPAAARCRAGPDLAGEPEPDPSERRDASSPPHGVRDVRDADAP